MIRLFNGLLFFFATPCGLWDFSSLTRVGTQAPAVRVLNPNH